MGLREWVRVRKALGRVFPPFPGPRCLSPRCQRGNKLCVSCRNETCSAEQMVLICSKLHSPALQNAWRAAAAAAPELTASCSELVGPCITIRGTKLPEPQDSYSSVLQGGSWLLVVRKEAVGLFPLRGSSLEEPVVPPRPHVAGLPDLGSLHGQLLSKYTWGPVQVGA